MYVDSHAHLEGSKFDADREAVLARAREAGVSTILLIGSGTGPGTYDCAIRLAEQKHENAPELFATLGVHPHEASLVGEADYSEMEKLAENQKVVFVRDQERRTDRELEENWRAVHAGEGRAC